MKQAGVIVVVVALTSACPQPPLSGLKVCGVEDFDEATRECASDGSSAPITTRQAICSLRVDGHQGETASGRFLYRGEEVSSFSDEITSNSGTLAFKFARAGMALLPGGPWRCEITVGSQTLSVDFTSGASEGPVLDAAVCPAGEVNPDADIPLCAEDHPTMEDLTTILCSATVAGANGKTVRSALLRGGTLLGSSSGIRLESELTAYAKQFSSQLASGFGPGDYVCRFLVADEVVAEHPFTLTAR